MLMREIMQRSSRPIWLVAAMLSATVLLATPDLVQGSPVPEPAVVSRTADGRDPSTRIVSYQFSPYTVAIPVFVNPNRQTLYPNEHVLLSVSDDWSRSDLYWDASIVAGDIDSEGYFTPVRGPFVTYVAPEDGQGQVRITVSGKLYGRTGIGVVDFLIR